MSHRNARTTVHGRQLIVQRYQDGWKQAHIAEAMGISRKCVHTWIRRYAEEGESGLRDRSSGPHSSPRRTAAQLEQQVLAARRLHRRGQDWLGPELGLSARTVGRILRRHHQPCLRDCDPMTGALIKASKATAIRYERQRPGELVHVDVKKLGKIPHGGGSRAHGRSEEVRARGIGYDFVHSMVDDHSRLAYSEILPDEKGPTCADFITRAAKYFAAIRMCFEVAGLPASVLVVVLAVRGVPAPVVHVVDMVPVRNGHMTTAVTMYVVVILMHGMSGRFTFVVVIIVPSMKVTVVHIVDMVPMRDRDMAASFAVDVVMINVFAVGCVGHSYLAAVRPNFDS